MSISNKKIRAGLIASPVVFLALAYVATWFIQTDAGVKGGIAPLGFMLTIWAGVLALTVVLISLFIAGVVRATKTVYDWAMTKVGD